MSKILCRQGEGTKWLKILCRQGEGLTKARITLFAEKNFVSKILCRQEGKAKKILLFIGEGVAVPDGVDLAGIVRVQVFAV